MEEAFEAFAHGDPGVAFEATQRLGEAYRGLLLENAKLRFQTNFGSSICNQCEGLHAGPGVVATCFQIRQCHYDNVREEADPRRLRILRTLTQK